MAQAQQHTKINSRTMSELDRRGSRLVTKMRDAGCLMLGIRDEND